VRAALSELIPSSWEIRRTFLTYGLCIDKTLLLVTGALTLADGPIIPPTLRDGDFGMLDWDLPLGLQRVVPSDSMIAVVVSKCTCKGLLSSLTRDTTQV
jgi:hypothetical protein